MTRPESNPGTRYVALLRGINVGRSKRVAMADLKALLDSLGFSQVTTLLQSGNALFSSTATSEAEMASQIEQGIAERLALEVKVLVRNLPELTRLVAENPLPLAAAEPARFHLTFLSDNPTPERVATIDAAAYAPDEFRFGDRTVYVWYRGGLLGSKLTYDLWEKRLGVVATARNWNTVTRLVVLGGAGSPTRV